MIAYPVRIIAKLFIIAYIVDSSCNNNSISIQITPLIKSGPDVTSLCTMRMIYVYLWLQGIYTFA